MRGEITWFDRTTDDRDDIERAEPMSKGWREWLTMLEGQPAVAAVSIELK